MYKCYMSLFSIPQKYNYSDCIGTKKHFYKQCYFMSQEQTLPLVCDACDSNI